jgi:Ca2+-binding RTX toxin-like protein
VSATARDAAGNADPTPAAIVFSIVPSDLPPVISSGGVASFVENGTGVAYQAEGSDPEGKPLTWSLGGPDAVLFAINAAGAVRFLAAPDFEAPADQGADNTYEIVVIASDGSLNSSKGVSITVTDENEAPTITSGAEASVPENSVGIVYQALATDPDAGAVLTWSLGGVDAGQFDVDATGGLSFKVAPNFEAPADFNGDNVYQVVVVASDGVLDAALTLTITVLDVQDTQSGSGKSETISGGDGADLLLGRGGNDVLEGGAGADEIRGGRGDDTMDGGTGGDLLRGGPGKDLVIGGEGDDSLRGWLGNDTLIGGNGADTLIGHEGADVFRFLSAAEGGDLIRRYSAADDVIEVSAAGFGGGLVAGETPAFVANQTGLASSVAGFGQFIWERDARILWWDADGAGGADAVALARFTGTVGGANGFNAGEIFVIA